VKLFVLVLLFVGFFFVWVPAALAQTPTPEPPTSTPVVTQIWPGPTRTPIGALGGCDPALTPDPNQYDLEYRFNCGHCFPKPTLSGSTSTPWPTVQHGTSQPGLTGTPGTGTPEATLTPGTVTPTVEVTQTPLPDYWLEDLGTYPYSYTGPGVRTENIQAPSFDPVGYAFYFDGHQEGGDSGAMFWSGWGSWFTNMFLYGYGYDGSGYKCFREAGQPVNVCDELFPGAEQRQDSSLPIFDQWTFNIAAPSTKTLWGTVHYWAIQASAQITPTPALPEMTPTGTVEPGFCSNSGSHLVEPIYSEILPLLYIRDGACLVVIPSIDAISPFIPESWTASDWSGVQVCMQYVGMGVVRLFGYEVYMLHYLTAGAAVAIIRRIMKG